MFTHLPIHKSETSIKTKKSSTIRTPHPKKNLHNFKKSWSRPCAILLFILSIQSSNLKIQVTKSLLKKISHPFYLGGMVPKSQNGEFFNRITSYCILKIFLTNLDEILANRSWNQPQLARKTARWLDIQKNSHFPKKLKSN